MWATLVRSIPQASMLNPIQLLKSMANDSAAATALGYASLPYQLGENENHVLESLTHLRPGRWATRSVLVVRGSGTRSCLNLDGSVPLSRR